MNPDVQLNLAALEDGANGHGEWLLTGTALVDAGARGLALKLRGFVDDAAVRADRAIRPMEDFEVLAGGVFVGINL